MIKYLPLLFITLFFASCGSEKDVTMEKKPQQEMGEGYYEMSGVLVSKPFIKKNGEPAGFEELYLRASIKDYFIKFCESEVSKEDLMPYVDKGITVVAKIENGTWDQCSDDPAEMQSRVGSYLIIRSIKS